MVDFGAFVNFMGSKDGLVHISEIKNERVSVVKDVLTEGQPVKVKVLGIDDRGKVRLSMRLVDQETGEEIADTRPPREGGEERGPRREGGPRRDGGDRGGRGGGGGAEGSGRGPRRDDRGPRNDDRGPRPERAAAPESEPTFAPTFLTGDRD